MKHKWNADFEFRVFSFQVSDGKALCWTENLKLNTENFSSLKQAEPE
jgi:hypothetical protein